MEADRATIKQWLQAIHGKSPGLLHLCGDGDWTGRRYTNGQIDSAVSYVLARDRGRTRGTYLRATTLADNAPDSDGKRAGAQWSASLPGLWADIDIAGPGHKHRPNHPTIPGYDQGKPEILPLPPDEESARRIVKEAALPEPTVWVHSGGGLYPWWMLDTPEDLTGDDFALNAATELSRGWQRAIVAAAGRLGFAYGDVGDLARVLRIPGTVNRKDGLERPCRILQSGGPRYTFDVLALCLAEASATGMPAQGPSLPLPSPLSPQPPALPGAGADRTGSAWDDFERRNSWGDILLPHGWQVHHTVGSEVHWTRPGKRLADGASATTGKDPNRDRLWVFSTSCGLPTDEPMTKPWAWGALNGHRDRPAVTKALLAAGYGIPYAQATPVGFTTQLPRQVSPVKPAQTVQTVQPVQPAQPQPESPWCQEPVRPGGAHQLPDFPVACLPPVMRDLVLQVAGSRQVDPTMPAMFALAAVAAVAAGKYRAFGGGDWHEALSLYTCTVADSGERKSPTGRPVFDPIGRIEDRMRVEHNTRIDLLVDELDKERGEAGRNPAAANRVEEKIREAELSRSNPPQILLADDITPAALAKLMAIYGGHGAILDPEGTFLGQLSGRYMSGKANPELVIKAYDGDRYMVERTGRSPDRIPRPTLAIGVAIQPTVLDEMMKNVQLLERGCLARFIWAIPASLVGRRWVRDAAPYSPAPGRAWAVALEGIAETAVSPEAPLLTIALDPDAMSRFVTLRDNIESRLIPGGDLSAVGLKEWSNKHAGRVLRIAALLRLIDGYTQTTEVTLSTMESAIAIGEWAIAHARQAHGITPESDEEATAKQTQQVLDWIVRTGQQQFTRRVACRGMKAQWVNTKSMGDALDQLAELGWVREEPYQDRGNRWRTRYVVSPHIALASG